MNRGGWYTGRGGSLAETPQWSRVSHSETTRTRIQTTITNANFGRVSSQANTPRVGSITTPDIFGAKKNTKGVDVFSARPVTNCVD
jgi:hypothetical protein